MGKEQGTFNGRNACKAHKNFGSGICNPFVPAEYELVLSSGFAAEAPLSKSGAFLNYRRGIVPAAPERGSRG